MIIPKLILEGKVAILISRGYGAGWYTWHYDKRLLFEPKIVEMLDDGADPHEIKSYCEKTYGDELYYGGVDGLEVHWLPIGTQFKIDNYDGAETLIISDDVRWITA